MVKKKARLYKTRSDGFKYVLYPKTHSSCITISDGKTVQDKLSTVNTNMFTPVIEASSFMFKVGAGDSVDLSSSVLDGAYNSCVLKGRTLVNITPSSIYRLAHPAEDGSYYTFVSETNKITITFNEITTNWKYIPITINLSMLKANTKYLVKANGNFYGNVSIKQGDGLNILASEVRFQNNYAILTTGAMTSEIGSQVLYFYPMPSSAQTTYVLSNIVLVEYQDGMENWDIPYFTGMCDVKSPILSNCGKNLINPALFKFQPNLSGDGSEKVESVGDDIIFYGANKGYYLDVILKENTSYYINYESRSDVTNIRLFDLDGWQINNLVPSTLTTNIQQNTIVTTNKKCRLRVWTEGSVAIIRKLIVAEATQAVPYEPYKSNILTCETYFDEVSQSDKTIVLRSLPNGVCDTLNVETGEYVQRIGEYTFDGSHPMYGSINITGDKYFYTCTNVVTDNKRNLATNNQICDILPVKNPYEHTDENCAWLFYNQHSSYFRIALKEYCNENRESDVILWLKENPVTVQYELETPVVKTVNLSGFPYAYKDGHVILESGSIEQSLLPKVEYSLSTNRIGQIQTNQKMIEKHQKEIDELQKMILTNMVNSQYQQALTMLNYELSRV